MPDQRGEGAAEHRSAVELGRHRDQLVRVADPHGDRVLVIPADEPGVAVVGGRARLAGREFSQRGGFRGSVLQDSLEHRRLGGGDFGGEHRCGPDLVDVVVGAVRQPVRSGVDFLDRHGRVVFGQRSADPSSTVGDRLVGVRHVERCDAGRQAADRHRRVGRERGGDAHPVSQARDPFRAHFQPDFGVDRVVRVGRRVGQRVGARVVAFVVVYDELFRAVRARNDEFLLLRGPGGVRRDSVLQRRGQVECLERGARLALAVGGQVERAFVVAAPADHRAHLAGGVFDRHDRRGGAAGVGEVVVDRLFGGALQFEVERRLHAQASVEGARSAVAFDHLLLDPAREVAGVDAFDLCSWGGWMSLGAGSAWLMLAS